MFICSISRGVTITCWIYSYIMLYIYTYRYLYLINISTTVYRYILWLVHVQKSLSQKSFAIASREPPVRWIQSPCGHLQIAISLCLKLGRPVASGYGQNILRITHGIPWVNGLSMFIHWKMAVFHFFTRLLLAVLVPDDVSSLLFLKNGNHCKQESVI